MASKKIYIISLIFVILSLILAIYSFTLTNKNSYLSRQLRAWYIAQAAKKYSSGSAERVRLEAIADATKKGLKSYIKKTNVISPNGL